ncbi:hypothetical protein A2331_06240 [Candidatus Falkowbacteria bacterium RIFOXYB2_FULL_34_18]|uniref:Nudix hydrolase domain-containing protein n=1 Tax=Candidatus Falkowbacteria bacterium RIFOXYD2_FULL_34_120 TaxID=1798007 RepID=A0A1F5TNT9_9BACT|nr:MAG: hypothetical protein A2331_06240 [Candidatus Falkowbacteria bacterium RIFOXYB2_FULL_34_18]OGF28768.1 MAG: hypothetical protein A2500_04460 [Candidatus Falkowbacteria bacterium RIFOXYC12_FULL_34_55]OGF35704.1 MAG: hypothetical protein A2466_05100 [Candidatus Falkowbacteria bacterium RIFOXYC2_FULL_34_220]OGF38420.1 MAG: hypothetical protein A2515_00595 [Candidatus Falkowbacteria bacterium RIFOXYD12_FULL_34_57]OGF40474.1 MAG: hypothetical protein A2531_03070 [Candidatus Falkowbacteria bact
MSKIILASGPVIVENNQVLLNISSKDNFWKFCGGRPKENENLQETAKRRVKEEMGIDIKIINDQPFLMHTKNDEGGDVILVHFLAKHIGEIKSGKDVKEWKWMNIDNLESNLAKNVIPALKYFGFTK